MSNDPLDAIFVTGEEAQKLKRDRQRIRLATYLDDMPMEIKSLFKERFSLISPAELAQLRATIADQARQLEEARTTIAGQAEQLRNSTDLIRRVWEMADDETSKQEIDTTSLMWQIEADTRTWLAANAPAPQAEATANHDLPLHDPKR